MLKTLRQVPKAHKVIDKDGFITLDRFRFHCKSDRLGQGAFGTVYKAKDLQFKQLVAIKIMSLQMFKDPYMKEMLKNEIIVMKELNNDHVVKIQSVFTDVNDEELFIVLEFCERGDLRSLMVRKIRFTEDQAIEILRQLLEGFKELVKHGYIHRDIKPENVLIKDNTFKVADFGFAAKIDINSSQRLKECVGTPLYMAPQILKKEPYGAKSDIWSIGLMFYEMLVGKPPWPCHDMVTYLHHITTQPLRFPYELQLSERVKSFIKECLMIDENKRLGWDRIFIHPLWINQNVASKLIAPPKNLNQLQQVQNIKFTKNEQRVLANLQDICERNGIEIRDLLKHEKAKHELNRDDFHRLLTKIDPNFTRYEADCLFLKFDMSKDNIVSANEFYQIFSEFDFTSITDAAKHIRIEIKEIIERHHLDISQIFNNFDKDKSGFLNQQEFEKFVRIVLPQLPKHDMDNLFGYFDRNKDKNINLDEFIKGLGLQKKQISKNDPVKQKSLRILSMLKSVIKEKKIDIDLLFNLHDKSGDGLIDIKEFTFLILKVESSLNQEETQYIFNILDKDQSGQISKEEFKQGLIS